MNYPSKGHYRDKKNTKSIQTSWNKVGQWYDDRVKDRGHYYHERLVLPNAVRLLELQKTSRVLDIGCGQGVLARRVPKDAEYVGLDVAKSLIEFAKQRDSQEKHAYHVCDATREFPKDIGIFSHAAAILSLQNMKDPEAVIDSISQHMDKKGKLVIVLNHPCFRIPRQSSWGMDEVNKLQYRKIQRYMSPLEIPITMHPGKDHSPVTWSFHRPLSFYVSALVKSGFVIDALEEWVSDKTSVGKVAKSENRSRAEFPLFLALRCKYIR